MRSMCRWCRPGLFIPLIALLALAGMVGGCTSVQNDVSARTGEALAAAGLTDVSIGDVSYRNVSLVGPDSLEFDAIDTVDELEETHDVTYEGDGSATSVSPATTGAAEPAEAATATIDATAQITQGIITLTGSVPDETTRSTIVNAAIAAYGEDNVDDRLTVDDTEATPELTAAAADLASAIAAFPGAFVSGQAVLADTNLSVIGAADTPAAADALTAALAGFTGATVTTDIVVAETPGVGVIDIQANYADGVVTLAGTVADEATRAGLVDAAIAEYGEANVVDQLEIDGTTPDASAAAAIEEFNDLLAGIDGNLSSGELILSGTQLSLTGYAISPESVTLLQDRVADYGTLEVDLELGVDAEDAVDAIGELLTLEPINFETNSDVITTDSEATLDTAVEYLIAAFAADPGLRLEIGGHTDSDGGADYNQDLSQRRASAVLQYLTDNGVPAEGLTAVGYGESDPIATNDTAEGRAQNRRIEFEIVEG